MTFDGKVTIALVAALVLEAMSAFVWIGSASARLDEVERKAVSQRELSERLARVEEQLIDVRRALARIESQLDAR